MVDMFRVASGVDVFVPANIRQSGKQIDTPMLPKQSHSRTIGPDKIEMAKNDTAVNSDAPTRKTLLS